jgi:hypothetical protein
MSALPVSNENVIGCGGVPRVPLTVKVTSGPPTGRSTVLARLRRVVNGERAWRTAWKGKASTPGSAKTKELKKVRLRAAEARVQAFMMICDVFMNDGDNDQTMNIPLGTSRV